MKNELDDFIDIFGNFLKSVNLFSNSMVSFEVLINPSAGSIINSKKLKAINKEIKNFKTENTINSKFSPNVQMHITRSLSHAQIKALEIVDNFVQDKLSTYKILILAGGDGFHKDICSSLIKGNLINKEELIIFRLPMGTGNDNCDCDNFYEVCRILSSPGNIQKSNLLVIKPKGLETDYSFNITSFGMDAYVCQLTEKWKRKIPGDIYKVMVDLSLLFYDLIYPIKESCVLIKYRNKEYKSIGKKLLLLIGAKGYSTYGGKKKILPDENNFLFVDFISLFKRLLVKGKFLKGSHINLPISHFDIVDEITVEYSDSLLMELDGEVTSLKPENFPVTIEVLKESFKVLG